MWVSPEIKALLESSAKEDEPENEPDIYSELEEEIVNNINDEILLNNTQPEEQEQEKEVKLGATEELDKEYLMKIKEEFDYQYKEEIDKWKNKIQALKNVIVDQDSMIKVMQEKLKQTEQEKTSQPKSQPNMDK